MRNIPRVLSGIAASSGSIYKIVFTALLTFELIRFEWRRRRDPQAALHLPGRRRD